MYRTPLNTGLYNACANLHRHIAVLPDGKRTSALGVKVDTVVATGTLVRFPEGNIQIGQNIDSRSLEPRIVISAAVLCEQARVKYPSCPLKHEDWSDVIWRTCAVDRSWAGKRLTAADRRHFKAFLEEFKLGPDIFEAGSPENTQRQPTTTSSPSQSRGFGDLPLREDWLPFSMIVNDFQKGQVLALTRNALLALCHVRHEPAMLSCSILRLGAVRSQACC